MAVAEIAIDGAILILPREDVSQNEVLGGGCSFPLLSLSLHGGHMAIVFQSLDHDAASLTSKA